MFRQLILVLFVSCFCLFSVSTDAVKPQGGGGEGRCITDSRLYEELRTRGLPFCASLKRKGRVKCLVLVFCRVAEMQLKQISATFKR